MRARLVVVFLVPLVAVMLALGTAAGWGAARSIQQGFYASQLGDLSYFVTSARQGLLSGSTTVFEGEAKRYREVHGIEVAVFDLSGAVWASSGGRIRPRRSGSRSPVVVPRPRPPCCRGR